MEEDIKKTYDDLFYKIVVIGKLNLSFIEDLVNFCNYFKDHKDFTKYKMKVKSDMSMIYSRNEVFDKSYGLDLELLLENSIDYLMYPIIISRIMNSSSILLHTDEIKEYVKDFILNGSKDNFTIKLTSLDWYTFHYLQEIEDNNDFERVFSEIIKALEAPTDNEQPLTERIKKLAVLKEESINFLHQLHWAYLNAAQEQRSTILGEYLHKTPLKFYQDIMKRNYPI